MPRNSTSHVAGTVGRNIKARRVAADLTQHELAVRLGTGDHMTVSRWERGEHVPTTTNLLLLARVLGCDAGDFYATERKEAA